jgi:hypothetical protein
MILRGYGIRVGLCRTLPKSRDNAPSVKYYIVLDVINEIGLQTTYQIVKMGPNSLDHS